MNMNSQRLLELDALRGMAALSVVIFHYFFRYNQIYGHENLAVEWSYLGHYGVHLFFMVSGFVIFWTLDKAKRPLDFLVSRFSRLYPVYWAAVVVTFSAIYTFGLSGREVSINSAIANILMFHEYLKIPHVDGVYWTLTVELTFYFWIFLIYLSSNLNKVEGIFSLLVVVSIAHSLGFVSIPSFLYKIFILKYISLFLAGICFYKLMAGVETKKTIVALTLSFASLVAIYSFKEFILFFFFYSVFFLIISGRLKILNIKPLVFLGSISYSLYLLHQNIGYIIINKTYELQLNPVFGVFSAIFVSVVLATLFMKFIEKPVLRVIRETYKNNKKMQRVAKNLSLSRNR